MIDDYVELIRPLLRNGCGASRVPEDNNRYLEYHRVVEALKELKPDASKYELEVLIDNLYGRRVKHA